MSCKPGSVEGCHSSWTPVASRLVARHHGPPRHRSQGLFLRLLPPPCRPFHPSSRGRLVSVAVARLAAGRRYLLGHVGEARTFLALRLVAYCAAAWKSDLFMVGRNNAPYAALPSEHPVLDKLEPHEASTCSWPRPAEPSPARHRIWEQNRKLQVSRSGTPMLSGRDCRGGLE
jgi:hypothetical protein